MTRRPDPPTPAPLLVAAAMGPPLPVLLEAALDAVVDGQLREFLRKLAPPLRRALLDALRAPEFSVRLARAREFAADVLADETIAIADDAAIPVERARLMIEARWRRCASLCPQVYGDRKFIEHSGRVELVLSSLAGSSSGPSAGDPSKLPAGCSLREPPAPSDVAVSPAMLEDTPHGEAVDKPVGAADKAPISTSGP